MRERLVAVAQILVSYQTGLPSVEFLWYGLAISITVTQSVFT